MTSISGSRSRLFVWLLISLLSACGGGDDGVVGTGLTDPPTGGPPGDTIRISGAAEKGPFVKGSEVLVSRLAADGVPSTDTTLSEIQDDLGTFMFAVKQPGPVLIAADGYHFNEITGALSQGRLLLRAVYNASANAEQKAYVNVLTHLAYKRTLVLMAQGMSVDAALKQAELDVLQALRSVLPVTEVTDFTQLSIYDLDTSRATGNGYVLALSATVYQLAMKKEQEQKSSVDAELTALLNGISDDISDDGSIADEAMLTDLTNSTRQLRPDLIRANLEERSVSARPEKLLVANMDLFIDTDGDGLINAQDDDIDNDGILNVEDASPYVYSEAPVLVANAATSGVASKTLFTLEWTTSEFAKQIEVQLVKDSADGPVIVDEVTATKQYTFTLDPGIYYVRARAQNVVGGWGPWSVASVLPAEAFAKAYSLGAESYVRDAIQTTNGGILVVGGVGAWPDAKAILTKLGHTGSLQWIYVPNQAGAYLWSPIELADQSFLLAVEVTDLNTNESTLRVVHIGPMGEELWQSGVLPGRLDPSTVKFLDEGDGVVLGATSYLGDQVLPDGSTVPDFSPLLVKLDSEGKILWSYQFDNGQNAYNGLAGLWKDVDGNYIIVGNLGNVNGVLTPYAYFRARLLGDRSQLSVLDSGIRAEDVAGAVPANDGGIVLAAFDLVEGGRFTKRSSVGEVLYLSSVDRGCNCELISPQFFS